MIDAYLAELRELLPRRLRRRVLAEVEDHLRESAAHHGEREAIRRFGSAAEVARGVAAVHVRAAVATAGLAVTALLAVPLFVYVVTENSLPPAPWPEGAMPHSLEWKIRAATALYGVALASFAAAGVLLLVRRAASIALLTLGAVAAAIGAMGIVGAALSLDWADEVTGAPRALAALGAAQTLVALAAAAAVAHASSVVRSAD